MKNTSDMTYELTLPGGDRDNFTDTIYLIRQLFHLKMVTEKDQDLILETLSKMEPVDMDVNYYLKGKNNE